MVAPSVTGNGAAAPLDGELDDDDGDEEDGGDEGPDEKGADELGVALGSEEPDPSKVGTREQPARSATVTAEPSTAVTDRADTDRADIARPMTVRCVFN
jgi:hypothetical protein